MATVDNLFDWMKQRHIERAVFVSDQPARLYVSGKELKGEVWPMKRLHNFAWEVLPADQRSQLSGETNLSISHHSSLGLYKITIERHTDTLKVEVAPEVCWFCQKRQPSRASMLYHKMIWRRQVGHITYWDRKALKIPRCSSCHFWHGITNYTSCATLILGAILFYQSGMPDLYPDRSLLKWLFIGHLSTYISLLAKGKTAKLKNNPDYQEAKQAGFGNVLY